MLLESRNSKHTYIYIYIYIYTYIQKHIDILLTIYATKMWRMTKAMPKMKCEH